MYILLHFYYDFISEKFHKKAVTLIHCP